MSGVSFQHVTAAAARIAGQVHRTPVISCQALDDLSGRALLFKCEHLQKVGAFKFRGASNAVALLSAEQRQRGVVTHSSGNHAQALALAARQAGIAAHIVMPRGAPAVKRAAVLGYGANVYECEPTLDAREATAAAVQAETGATFIHPYDNDDVIAGQGTAALELLDQAGALDAVLVPVGGGGLAAGTCLALAGRSPTTRVLAAEPTGADDAARSFAAGRRLPPGPPQTLADGLLTGLGERTWPVLAAHLEAVITVTDEQIIAAMRLLWERAKQMVEPSSATVLAAVLTDAGRAALGDAKRVGLILSGGNVDLSALPFSAR